MRSVIQVFAIDANAFKVASWTKLANHPTTFDFASVQSNARISEIVLGRGCLEERGGAVAVQTALHSGSYTKHLTKTEQIHLNKLVLRSEVIHLFIHFFLIKCPATLVLSVMSTDQW